MTRTAIAHVITCLSFLVLISACTQNKPKPPASPPRQANGPHWYWGFVGHGGRTIPCIFDRVGMFQNGFASVNYRGKWGIIDTTGRFVIPPEFERVEVSRHGIAKVWKREIGDSVSKPIFVDITNHPVPAPQWWGLKWYYACDPERLHAMPDSVTKLRLDRYIARSDSEAHAVMQRGGDPILSHSLPPLRTDRYGYVDSTGKFVIPPNYVHASSFFDGLAWVAFDTGRAPMVCIDTTGTVVISPRLDGGGIFADARCAVSEGSLIGYIDRTGNLVIPPRYERAGYFSEGRAIVCMHGRYGVIDTSGNQVVSCVYEGMIPYSPDANGRIRFAFGGKWGFLDAQGQIAIWPQYDEVQAFNYGLAVFALKDQHGERIYGVMDTTGTWVAAPIYDLVNYSYGGPVPVGLKR